MSAPAPRTVTARPLSLPREARSAGRSDWMFRGVIVVALCASAALAWWSLKVRLLPLQKQSRELAMSVSHLSITVDELERQWPEAKQEEVARRLAQAHHQLFRNQAALETWLSRADAQAAPLLLETKTALGQSVSKVSGEEEVAIIPTTISVEVQPRRNNPLKGSAYERVLRLTQGLMDSKQRADLAELSVDGGTNSIAHAKLVFHLWAGEGSKR